MNNYSVIAYKDHRTDRWGDWIQSDDCQVYLNINRNKLIDKCVYFEENNYYFLILKDGKRMSWRDDLDNVYDDSDVEISEDCETEHAEIMTIVHTTVEKNQEDRIQKEKEKKEKEEQDKKEAETKKEKELLEKLKAKYES